MRDIKALLKLTRKKIIPYMLFRRCGGICATTVAMLQGGCVSLNELIALDNYIEEHRPQYALRGTYWWRRGLIMPRYLFLSKLIREL